MIGSVTLRDGYENVLLFGSKMSPDISKCCSHVNGNSTITKRHNTSIITMPLHYYIHRIRTNITNVCRSIKRYLKWSAVGPQN